MPLHQKAEALFDFSPTAGVELKLRKGDIVQVLRMSVGEGWWEGDLNGFRGLFPSSYVRLLPEQSPSHESPKSIASDGPVMPLTPGLSKKAFMEALLAPTNMAHGQHYSEDKANEIFLEQHRNVMVTVGPSWSCQPPTLTISVKPARFDSRASMGSKQFLSYAVETKEWMSSVTRKYKQFLWLYDKLAEVFPCISLPPLPVKQNSTPKDFDGMKARRAGLEKFLTRVANHPVLSCTKVFHLFLTAKDDKEWKIGRHNSHIKAPKSAKKLFSAPIYTSVRYPAYNVPLTQLASVDKFAKFTRLLEMNVQSLQFSCLHMSGAMGELMQSFNYLGKDLQKFSKGIQLNTGTRRKLHSVTIVGSGLANGPPASIHASVAAPKLTAEDDEASDEEMGGGTDWNWREDESFLKMCKDLYDIAGGIRGLSKLGQEHQEAVDKDVVDTLGDYSSIIHTLPVLVKLHEEAMEIFQASKDKDTKKDAEEVRQHCETLNNILLAEFDNFSVNMIQDFENMVERLLQQQVKFHTQMASEWDALHRLYSKRLSSSSSSAVAQDRQSKGPFSLERLSGGGRPRSGSLKNSFTSSLGSSSSVQDTPLSRDVRSNSSPAPPVPPPKPNCEVSAPVYINVQRKPTVATDIVEPDDLIDPEIFKPKKKQKKKEEEVEKDKAKQAWKEDELRCAEHDDDECRLVEQEIPATQPTLYEIQLQGKCSLAKDQMSQRDDWTSMSTEGEATPTSHAPPEEQAAAVSFSNYPPRYEECIPNPAPDTVEISERYETSFPVHLPRYTEQEAEGETQKHTYKNVPLLKAQEDVQPQENGQDVDVTQDDEGPRQFLVSSTCPIYSNITLLQSGNQDLGSSPPTSTAKSAKKPMPIQRKRTKSEDLLGEGDLSTALAASSSEACLGSDAAAADGKGKVVGSPSAAKKKPMPPVKPAKLSMYMDSSPQMKRPMIPVVKKEGKVGGGGGEGDGRGDVGGKERTRPHSSSISDEGELSLSGELPVSKPRSLTQSSTDEKTKKQPLLVPSFMSNPVATSATTATNVSASTSRLASDTNVDMSVSRYDEQEQHRNELAEQTQHGLKVCGVLLSPSGGGEKSLSDTEDGFCLSEDRPPSPLVPPPPSTTSKHSPATSQNPEPQSSQNEKRTTTVAVADKFRPPAKPPRIGSVKKKNSTSSPKSGGEFSSSENSPSGCDELMRKLSLRRMKIEEQIAVKTGSASSPDVSIIRTSETSSPLPSDLYSLSEDSGGRASQVSSSSTNSEVVVAYHAKGGGGGVGRRNVASGHGSSSNGLSRDSNSYGMDGPDIAVVLRKDGKTSEDEDGSLAKYGIIEDVAGGSYVI